MEANNIIEGNKLIAVFMNYPKEVPGSLLNATKHDKFQTPFDRLPIPDYALEFHKNWSWIMPVVEKILKVVFNDDEYCYLRTFGMIHESTHQYMVRFNRYGLHSADTLIEATWRAVIEFIKSV